MRRFACLALISAGCSATPPPEWEAAPAMDARLPGLLIEACLEFEQRRYGRAIRLCDDALEIAPGLLVATEIREFAGKAQHTDDPHRTMTARVLAWRSITQAEPGAVPRRRGGPGR